MSDLPEPNPRSAAPEGPDDLGERAPASAGQESETGSRPASEPGGTEPAPSDPLFSLGDEPIDQEEADRSARVLSGIPAAVAMGEVRNRGPLAAGTGAIAAGSVHITTIDPRREKYSSSAASGLASRLQALKGCAQDTCRSAENGQ